MKKDKNKKIYIFLSSLYTLNNNTSRIILNDLSIGNDLRFKELNSTKLMQLYKWLEKNNIKLKK